jgi:hypothetical protein
MNVDSPLVGLLLMSLTVLIPIVLTESLPREAYENPGGWKFPKGEVFALGGMLLGLILTLLVSYVLVN